MSTTYQQIKKKSPVPVSGREKTVGTQARPMRGADPAGGGMGEALDAGMQARMQRFLDNQNPQAEQEADEIAAGLSNARTPQEVKTQLGERMGADFSSVRFHTGGDAAERAEDIGARAYARGRDIYFGEGGFDPVIAAHELVHTAQQGMVDSGAVTQTVSAGTVQMWPWSKKKTGSLEEKDRLRAKRDAENAKLAKMGPEAMERILSGQGGKRENKQFQKIMKILNGSVDSGELSEENIRMLYGAGEASRNFIVNRTLDNMVSHIQGKHKEASPNGYAKTGAEHESYMATLQNKGVREGNGGALNEYGSLSKILSQPAMDSTITSLVGSMPAELNGVESSDEQYKAATKQAGDQMIAALPGRMQGNSDDLRAYNGAFMEKLRAAMPEAFSDEEVTRSFVGKSSALRGVFPALTTDNRMQNDTFAIRTGQRGLMVANQMMSPDQRIANTPAASTMLRNAITPGFSQPTPAPVPAPAPVLGEKTSEQTYAYRGITPPEHITADSSEDEALAKMYYNIKNPDKTQKDWEEDLSVRRRHFAEVRARQMAEQQAAAPQEKKKKWWQFWK